MSIRAILLEAVQLSSIVGIGGSDMQKNLQKIIAGTIIYLLLPSINKLPKVKKLWTVRYCLEFLKWFPLLSTIFKNLKIRAKRYFEETLQISCVVFYKDSKVIKLIGNRSGHIDSEKKVSECSELAHISETCDESRKSITSAVLKKTLDCASAHVVCSKRTNLARAGNSKNVIEIIKIIEISIEDKNNVNMIFCDNPDIDSQIGSQ